MIELKVESVMSNCLGDHESARLLDEAIRCGDVESLFLKDGRVHGADDAVSLLMHH